MAVEQPRGGAGPRTAGLNKSARARFRARLLQERRRAREMYADVPYLPKIIDELGRVELLDRSLVLGAQALLALIPLLMVVGAFMPADWGNEFTAQVRDVIGVGNDVMQPVQQAASSASSAVSEVSWLGLLIALASASSFARALERTYCKIWDLPANRGIGAIRRSLLWIGGWVVTLQILAIALRAFSDVPLTLVVHLSLQFGFNVLLWWWTAHLLLHGRVRWRALLPGAVVSASLVVLLSAASSVFMPRYAQANLEQFGPLGVVFAIASWLVVFGGVLVLAAVVGRHLPGVEALRRAPRS